MLAKIPLGNQLNSVRVRPQPALRALEHPQRGGRPHDSILYNAAAGWIEFFLPGGSATNWTGGWPITRAVGRESGYSTKCPRPGLVVGGIFWLCPPGPYLTPPDRLADALAEAGVEGVRYRGPTTTRARRNPARPDRASTSP